MKLQPILTQATEEYLTFAVHENLYALFRSMQVLPGCELVESDKLSYHHAFPTNPMFKGIWRTRLSDEEIETEISKAVSWFNQHEAPYFFWWTDSQTQPGDLAERLLKHGFDGNLEGDPGMAMDLHSLKEVSTPDGYTIVQAVDQTTLKDWREVFATAFEMPLSGAQAWVDAILSIGGENAPWQMYVGYLEGAPVATSILFKGAGVAGIYGVGTLLKARNRGIGTAITMKPLLDARTEGFRFAVLFATRMGYPVYEKIGFHEVANKIGIYNLEKD
ncbi:MAG: GNAT family N-acetyltransferase [Chloroflexi bacterium]|nr:GNAT family N-acetyltransferase [Chloroflexota bacterium]